MDAASATKQARRPPVVEIDGIVTRVGSQTVHNGVSFDVQRGTLVAQIAVPPLLG